MSTTHSVVSIFAHQDKAAEAIKSLQALEHAAEVRGLSALGAAFYSIGLPSDSFLQYETALMAEKLLLAVNGTPEEVTSAERLLADTSAMHTRMHVG